MPRSLWIAQSLVTASVMLGGCKATPTASATRDIFSDDTGNRRRQAAADESLWTIFLGGCTGSLLSADYLITANHCSPQPGANYRSGSAMNHGARADDLTAVDVVEASSDLDYAIVQIQWNAGQKPTDQHLPPKIATQAADVVTSTAAGQGDTVFTVGFPGDVSRSLGATYAEGQLKEARDTRLAYNIGIINGNSGGGVWRSSDKMLVSLTNNGPHALGDSGWDQNSVDDASAWNSGPAAWDLYAQSKTLQDIFPAGINRFVGETGAAQVAAPATDAFLALELTSGGAYLWVALSDDLDRPAVCATKNASACTPGASDFTFDLKRTVGGRKIFRSQTIAAVRDGMLLTLAGYNGKGALKSSSKLSLRTVN